MPAAWRPLYVSFKKIQPDEEYKAVVRLPTNVKKVAAIKLVGCRCNLVGATEVPDDFVMLDIKEAQSNNGELITNYEMLNSNFFALPTTELDTLPLWDSSAEGLRCVAFTPRNMPMLTFQLKTPKNAIHRKPPLQSAMTFVAGSSPVTTYNLSQPVFDPQRALVTVTPFALGTGFFGAQSLLSPQPATGPAPVELLLGEDFTILPDTVTGGSTLNLLTQAPSVGDRIDVTIRHQCDLWLRILTECDD